MLRLKWLLLTGFAFLSHSVFASVPMGSRSQIATTALGRRVVLRWSLPNIYPGQAVGALVCVASGNAPIYIKMTDIYQQTFTLPADAISPQCVQLNNFLIESDAPFRLSAVFDMNDTATFEVFPATSSLNGRIDFAAESNRGSTGVLQIQSNSLSNVYDDRSVVFCSNSLAKPVAAFLSFDHSDDSYPLGLYSRTDTCTKIEGIAFDKKGNWVVTVELAGTEIFNFSIPVMERSRRN